MVSATGPTTAIGIPQKNTGDLLPRKIGDVTIEYIQLDDGGDTTRAVQNVKKLIQENNVDALIGPSTTPNALAILDVIAESKVPLMATVGTSSVVEPLDAKKRWVFKTTQNDDLIAAALVRHMVKNGVQDGRLHRLQRSLRRELVQGVRAARREGGHQGRRERALRAHRLERDRSGAEAHRREARCGAHRRAWAAGACCRRRRCATRATRARSTRRTAWRPTTSSGSARRRSRARCSLRGRCSCIDEIADSEPDQEGRAALHRRVREAVRQQARDVRRQHVGRRADPAARDSRSR